VSGNYIALAAPVVMAAVILFVPYRPVSASGYRRARWAAVTLVAVSLVWLAIAVSDIIWSGPLLRDLLVATSLLVGSVYVLVRVVRQGRSLRRSTPGSPGDPSAGGGGD
jgi:hypothetical protein